MSPRFPTDTREPSERELLLLRQLARQAPNLGPDWLIGLLVRPMNDGGMGSLQLFPRHVENTERRFGMSVAQLMFEDLDGIKVSVELYVDTEGEPFELDSWKVDFGPLIELPRDEQSFRADQTVPVKRSPQKSHD